jgi:hydrogenase maturation factor
MPILPVGKLRAELLERMLGKFAPSSPRVIVGPRVGEDAAVLDMGDRYLVATMDPITFASDDLGWYALCVNANDLAVRGARPLWFLATLLLPEGATSETRAEDLFTQLGEACAELDVALIGGHTEVTADLPRPIIVGCMLGEVEKDRLVTTGGAEEGDVLLLTKGVPLEGAAILARERGAEAERRGVGADVVGRARDFLRRPGISVLPEARLACGAATVHSMHDPTEGGIATALWEMADAAEVGLAVEAERIPVLAEGAVLCREFGLDPLGTIASGALLLALAPTDAGIVLHALAREGIDAAFIGRVVPREAGVVLTRGGQPGPLPRFDQDEITRLFA